MLITPEYVALKRSIAEQLVADGWTCASEFDIAFSCLLASKDYATAVGPKTATVSLEPRSEGFQMVGNYQSEGRNILSTTWFSIPNGLDADYVGAGTSAFVAKVDAEVDQSYARRLL